MMWENRDQHIAGLITGYLREELSPAGHSELEAWLAEAPENRAFFGRLTSAHGLTEELQHFYKYDAAAGRDKIAAEFPALAKPAAKKVSMRPVYRWAAAAAAILITGSAIVLYTTRTQPASQPAVATAQQQDAEPGGYKATLTLAGGEKIDLRQKAEGALANADGAAVQKADSGSLVYTGNAAKTTLHTLSTPRGGQYHLVLPDGTNVWLNASSSITFPTAFTGPGRAVTVTGEAYMEVTRNAAQPFSVTLPNGNSLDVLGTAFNIHAYHDEPTIKTTLLTGRIRYNAGAGSFVLRPGQQVEVQGKQPPAIVAGGEDAIAWKNGVINLQNTDLATLSRQLARWYNIDVRLNTPDTRQVFGGVINRKAKLSTVMKALSVYGIQTKLENNVLTIE